jgi:hypothetical protein
VFVTFGFLLIDWLDRGSLNHPRQEIIERASAEAGYTHLKKPTPHWEVDFPMGVMNQISEEIARYCMVQDRVKVPVFGLGRTHS